MDKRRLVSCIKEMDSARVSVESPTDFSLSKLDIASGSANIDGMSGGKVFSRVGCVSVVPADLCPPFGHAGVEVGVFFGCLGYGLVPLLISIHAPVKGATLFVPNRCASASRKRGGRDLSRKPTAWAVKAKKSPRSLDQTGGVIDFQGYFFMAFGSVVVFGSLMFFSSFLSKIYWLISVSLFPLKT